jgi:hypothetical protein
MLGQDQEHFVPQPYRGISSRILPPIRKYYHTYTKSLERVLRDLMIPPSGS